MAEENGREESSVLDWAAGIVGKVYDAVLDGGRIESATLQGFSELGNALQAFPDSIQVEPPRMGDALPSPAEIAGAGSIYGDTPAVSNALPSPADIASQDVTAEMTNGMELEQQHGKSM